MKTLRSPASPTEYNGWPKTESPPPLGIVTLRNQRVLLDLELTRPYGVETRALNQAVKRNLDRFPPKFTFQLTRE